METRPRILLLDDDALSRQALAEVLDGAGFAIVAVATQPHDLVLAAERPEPSLAPFVPLAKPVRVGALVAALRQALAQGAAPRIGPWRFDEAGRLLDDEAGRKIRLTDKEAAILAYLRRDGGVVARDTLLIEVWGYSTAVATHTLETHIYRLRRKIERPGEPPLLLTEAGGYRLA